MNFSACSFFIFVVFFAFSISPALSGESKKINFNKYSSVKIYFVHWDILTRTMLTPENVRAIKHLYIEINESEMISKVVETIYNTNFHDRDNTLPEPARLVIDFIQKDGTVDTIYANESHVLNKKSDKYKILDKKILNLICNFFREKEK